LARTDQGDGLTRVMVEYVNNIVRDYKDVPRYRSTRTSIQYSTSYLLILLPSKAEYTGLVLLCLQFANSPAFRVVAQVKREE
jgi:hypothetical protein